jgi:hypothetical protein
VKSAPHSLKSGCATKTDLGAANAKNKFNGARPAKAGRALQRQLQGGAETPALRTATANIYAHCALAGASLTRVWSVIQFTSQVWPPSSEKDCSKWGVSVLIFDQS